MATPKYKPGQKCLIIKSDYFPEHVMLVVTLGEIAPSEELWPDHLDGTMATDDEVYWDMDPPLSDPIGKAESIVYEEAALMPIDDPTIAEELKNETLEIQPGELVPAGD
jgi:hypothetical protein